jgi:hypothetical protein
MAAKALASGTQLDIGDDVAMTDAPTTGELDCL